MTSFYPAFLDLRGRNCLVVGGGEVGCRKASGLVAAQARVTVVAPRLRSGLQELVDAGTVAWRQGEFRPDDLEGMDLAFVATGERSVNAAVARAARGRRIWVNVADAPEEGDLIVPAVARQGAVTLAVGTGGGSPALAAWLRDRIAKHLPPGLGELAEITQRVRETTRGQGSVGRSAYLEFFESGVLDDLARGDRPAALAKAERIFGQHGAGSEEHRIVPSEAR